MLFITQSNPSQNILSGLWLISYTQNTHSGQKEPATGARDGSEIKGEHMGEQIMLSH